VTGRLRRQQLAIRIDSECKHCGKPLQMLVTDDIEWRLMSPTRMPLLFMPDVNWMMFRGANIIRYEWSIATLRLRGSVRQGRRIIAGMPLRFIPDVHRATHRIALYLEETADFDVNQAEAHVLAHLAAFGGSTVAEIHKAFAHKRSTLTSILDRLADRGLVTRQTTETDRRSFTIRLTPAGKKLAGKVYEHLRTFEDHVLRNVSHDDLRAFLRVLAAAEEPQRTVKPRRRTWK